MGTHCRAAAGHIKISTGFYSSWISILKSWNNNQLLKEAVQEFVETVAAANPSASLFPTQG